MTVLGAQFTDLTAVQTLDRDAGALKYKVPIAAVAGRVGAGMKMRFATTLLKRERTLRRLGYP
jgi:hypothetical protein